MNMERVSQVDATYNQLKHILATDDAAFLNLCQYDIKGVETEEDVIDAFVHIFGQSLATTEIGSLFPDEFKRLLYRLMCQVHCPALADRLSDIRSPKILGNGLCYLTILDTLNKKVYKVLKSDEAITARVLKDSSRCSVNFAAWRRRLVRHVNMWMTRLKDLQGVTVPILHEPLMDEENVLQGYVMEELTGVSLEKIMENGPITDMKEVFRLMKLILTALQNLHDAGVYYRDLKPANIIIGDNVAYLFDLDISLHADHANLPEGDPNRITSSGIVLGSLHYMSPEQIKGDRDSFGASFDVYGAAVILYEMITGKVPYDGKYVRDIMSQHLDQDPNMDRVEKRRNGTYLAEIIAKGMAKKPCDRFQNAEEFIAELEAYMATAPMARFKNVCAMLQERFRCFVARLETIV